MRRNKLPKPGLQFRISMFFVSIAGMAAVFQVFLVNRTLMSVTSYLPNDGALLLDALPTVFWSGMVWTLGIMMPVMVSFGILVTFRIAGPARRMEQYLNDIASGATPTRCTIRERDELQDLCDALNRGIEALHTRGDVESSSEAPALESAEPELAER